MAEQVSLLTKKSSANEQKKTYSYEEAFEDAKTYFKGDELAANVWINKYALKDSQGLIYESNPDQMHHRLAGELARIEAKYPNSMSEKEIYNVLKGFNHIIPQGGPMTGIGNNLQISSLSNCFVIGSSGKADSYGGVMKIDEEQVQLMKRRGGVGHDLTHIRPNRSPVMNSALSSTGVVPFMERYSNSTREVAQDGRRGALMLTISIKHPDAEEFINAKLDGTKVTGANISIKMDDDFMQAVKEDKEYVQQFPVESDEPVFTKKINARSLWNKIIHNAWKSAEPGILFWDKIVSEAIPDHYADYGFTTISTNPCGEIPLCPYDSCRLLALNLFGYVDEPFTKKASFNFEKFKIHAGIAQRIMDDVVDLEIEKIDRILEKIENDPEADEVKSTELNLWLKIREKSIQGRRTGVGITAEGDMLAALDIQYGSKKGIEFSTKVHKTLAIEAYRSSVHMARDRGAFPIYETQREIDNPFINRIKDADPDLYKEMEKYGRRNISMLTIAPTGTTSIMSQTTSGIEPVFMVSYKRRRKVNPNDKSSRIDFVDETGDSWEEYNVFHHNFLKWLELNDYDLDEISKLSDDELQKIIVKSPYHKSTANDVDWVSKVNMQGEVQKWVDHSISVTVNVPNDVKEELVSDIYLAGWESGCKGITVYRDGSRSGVLVSNDKKDKDEDGFNAHNAPKRPQKLDADVVRFYNDKEKWIAIVGKFKDRPYEIFTGRAEDSFSILGKVDSGWVLKNRNGDGKARYDFQYEDKDGYKITIEGLSRTFNKEYHNYARLISGVLRHGMPLVYAVDMVSNLHLDEATLNTWKNGVVRTLKRYVPNGTIPVENECRECGQEALVYEEGCVNCKSCGHSKCG